MFSELVILSYVVTYSVIKYDLIHTVERHVVATVDLEITRRQFLASSLAGSALMGARVPGLAYKYPEPAS